MPKNIKRCADGKIKADPPSRLRTQSDRRNRDDKVERVMERHVYTSLTMTQIQTAQLDGKHVRELLEDAYDQGARRLSDKFVKALVAKFVKSSNPLTAIEIDKNQIIRDDFVDVMEIAIHPDNKVRDVEPIRLMLRHGVERSKGDRSKLHVYTHMHMCVYICSLVFQLFLFSKTVQLFVFLGGGGAKN